MPSGQKQIKATNLVTQGPFDISGAGITITKHQDLNPASSIYRLRYDTTNLSTGQEPTITFNYTNGKTHTIHIPVEKQDQYILPTEQQLYICNSIDININNPHLYSLSCTIWIDSQNSETSDNCSIITHISPSDSGLIQIEGGNSQPQGTSVLLTAIAKQGYVFNHWDDGTSNPNRTIILSGAQMDVTAYFKSSGDPVITKYDVSATVNPSSGGRVMGTGSFNKGSTVTLKAIANPGYSFQQWEDGSRETPRVILNLSQHMAVTAYFKKNENTPDWNDPINGDPIYLPTPPSNPYNKDIIQLYDTSNKMTEDKIYPITKTDAVQTGVDAYGQAQYDLNQQLTNAKNTIKQLKAELDLITQYDFLYDSDTKTLTIVTK